MYLTFMNTFEYMNIRPKGKTSEVSEVKITPVLHD